MNNTILLNTSLGDEPSSCKMYAKEFLPATASREQNASINDKLTGISDNYSKMALSELSIN